MRGGGWRVGRGPTHITSTAELPHSSMLRCREKAAAHLDHEEVLLDDAVVGEAAQGGDVLLGHVEVGGGAVAGVALLAQLVHLWACSAEQHSVQSMFSTARAQSSPGSELSRHACVYMCCSRSGVQLPCAVACSWAPAAPLLAVLPLQLPLSSLCAHDMDNSRTRARTRTFLLISVRWWKPC